MYFAAKLPSSVEVEDTLEVESGQQNILIMYAM